MKKQLLLALIMCCTTIEIFTTQPTTKADYFQKDENPVSTTSLVNQARNANIEHVHVYFVTLNGDLKEVIIPFHRFEAALLDGLKFDGSSIPGCSNIYDSDMHLELDKLSFFVNPKIKGQPQSARIFADVQQTAGIKYDADPRSQLKEKMKEADSNGYRLLVGAEVEFFLLKDAGPEKITFWDQGNYFDSEQNLKHETIKFEMMEILLDNGINIEKLHHEVAPGQHEISIRYTNPIDMADQIILAKHFIKQIAQKHGLTATFMPKIAHNINGSGMHIHFSVADSSGWNLFYDNEEEYKLSPLAQRFIAGILHYVQSCDIVLNSSYNSFKRLLPGYEAPTFICWSLKNRSALIRIPMINESQPEATRAELRCPDCTCNPYLAFMFILGAGMKGITEDLQINPPQNDNLFTLSPEEQKKRNITHLPENMHKALECFESIDQIFALYEIFNETIVQEYWKIKTQELITCATAIHSIEYQLYL